MRDNLLHSHLNKSWGVTAARLALQEMLQVKKDTRYWSHSKIWRATIKVNIWQKKYYNVGLQLHFFLYDLEEMHKNYKYVNGYTIFKDVICDFTNKG